MAAAHRRRNHARRRTPVGSSPGVVTVDPDAPKPHVSVIAFGPDDLVEQEIGDLSELAGHMERFPVVWVNVVGLGDADLLHRLGELFSIHRLVLEDIVNVVQRPKTEVYDDQIFVVARMPREAEPLETEQLSIVVGARWLVTFQEREGDVFEPVRKRIREQRPRLRGNGADYLTYALLDATVDSYFPVLERWGDRLEELEAEILDNATQNSIARLHQVKRNLTSLRRYVWPMREMLSALGREDIPHMTDYTQLYLRDCYDHCIQLMDLVESYRDISGGLVDLYMSSVSNRMNEVMKVLTIIATIFIPLSFIAGLYGMNFDTTKSPWNLPELSWYLGYPFALGLMLLIAVGLLFYFQRRGWLGRSSSDDSDDS